jgi:hypothetical protein
MTQSKRLTQGGCVPFSRATQLVAVREKQFESAFGRASSKDSSFTLSRSGDGDNQGKVRKCQDASASELPPSPVVGVAMKDGGQTSDDENEVPDASDEHHQRVWPLHVAGSEKRPQLTQASLHQVSHEQAEGVPDYCNCDSSTVPPRTVAPRQNDDRNVNQCLKEMKRPQIGNDERGSRQGY